MYWFITDLCPRYSYMLLVYLKKKLHFKKYENSYGVIVPEKLTLQNWMHLTAPSLEQTYYVAPVG